jgi:hypothetical protein
MIVINGELLKRIESDGHIVKDLLLELIDNYIPISIEAYGTRTPFLSILINIDWGVSVKNFNLSENIDSLNNMIDFLKSEGYSILDKSEISYYGLKENMISHRSYLASNGFYFNEISDFESLDNFREILNNIGDVKIHRIILRIKLN